MLLICKDGDYYDIVNIRGELSTVQKIDGKWVTEHYEGCPMSLVSDEEEGINRILESVNCYLEYEGDSLYRALLHGYTSMDMPVLGHIAALLKKYTEELDTCDWLVEVANEELSRKRFREFIRDYPPKKLLRGYAKEMRRESEYYEYIEADAHKSAKLFNRANCFEQLADAMEARSWQTF
jgi:hypothetical protein